MATKLSFDDKPLVLAGPMVRRVDDGGASVWVATKSACTVTLALYGQNGDDVVESTASTVSLGRYLHVAVVTAQAPLQWGQTYDYDMRFSQAATTGGGGGGAAALGLMEPGVLVVEADPVRARQAARQRFTYCDDATEKPRPSFRLPPTDLEGVRIVHGSCRLISGEGDDALCGLDDMLRRAHDEPARNERPQQFVMTGDQVYINNVAPEILPSLTALGDALMGWQERLPAIDAYAADYGPDSREDLMHRYAGILEYGDANHLISLGEMYALYLLTYSDTLWPTTLPAGKRGDNLGRFRDTLWRARRALAHTATYMIFDDHEVTDDWYLTLHWCRNVLAKPLGRRLLVNALSAYAVFQAWGNTPSQFASGAGADLLRLLARWRGEADDSARAERVGIPTLDDVNAQQPPALQPPDTALRWHFHWSSPSYDMTVLDTRTWRDFPGHSDIDRPGLLSERGVHAQIADTYDKKVLVLVSSSVFLEVSPPWYVRLYLWWQRNHNAFRKRRGWRYADAYDPDRGDAWQGQASAFERLLATLATRVRARRVVALTGDIHLTTAARLQYQASRPWAQAASNDESAATTLTLAHFSSSPMRKEHSGTRLTHRVGYGLWARPPVRRWFGYWRVPGQYAKGMVMRVARWWRRRKPRDWDYEMRFLAGRELDSGASQQIVGLNNICEIVFSSDQDCVRQRVWWSKAGAFEPQVEYEVVMADAITSDSSDTTTKTP